MMDESKFNQSIVNCGANYRLQHHKNRLNNGNEREPETKRGGDRKPEVDMASEIMKL